MFSEKTSTVAFDFVIPDDLIHKSPIVPEKWYTVLPEYYQKKIPPEIRKLSKNELLSILENNVVAEPLSSPFFDESTIAMLPALLQCLTVPVRIYCKIEHGHTIMSTYCVRYNSRFSSLPQLNVPVNRNPVIDSVGLYTVDKK